MQTEACDSDTTVTTMPPAKRARVAVKTVLAEIAGALPQNHGEVWNNLLESLANADRKELALHLADLLAAQATEPEARQAALAWVARLAAARGDWQRAREVALQLTKDGGPAEAHVVLAQSHLHANEVRLALETAEKGRQAHPNNTELMFVAAEILIEHKSVLDLGDNPRAWRDRIDPLLDSLKPYAIRRPRFRHRYYMLSARYNADRGQLPSAISNYRKAAEARPSDPEPLVRLAELLEKDRQTRDAAEIYRLVIDRFPSHPKAPEFAVKLVELNRRLDTLDRFRSSKPPLDP